MSDDTIVRDLRQAHEFSPWSLFDRAAREIEMLRDEGDRLRLTVENLRVRLQHAADVQSGEL